ncbi:hypothetical protein [Burkholderia pseudomallei]|uniref:hypothetical protein n=1 Tax=Burkholderia pseudomallei TaxID=28450 RepID=UPI000A1A1609|nr:hypothetical protein [Burkholderia pseudomallei]ARK86083.1 hypothetical protein BOC42_00525 [Burkholderia pseudomallei]
MDKINDGGPAFPVADPFALNPRDKAEMERLASGMTLRDYFAAKAMAGMLAYPGCESRGSHHNNNTPDGVATMAYEYADAMLRAREN